MPRFRFFALTPDRWADLVTLFGSRGACGGCWCMTPRLTRRQYEAQKGEGNRHAFRSIVRAGREPGVLGYLGAEPVSWCSVEPRERFALLAGSRILRPLDAEPVWSITCLFVRRDQRRRGLSVATLRAAAAHAFSRGARIVEGYPVEPRSDPMPPVFAYTGIAAAFLKAGFEEAARRSATRPVMRLKAPARRRKAASRRLARSRQL